MKPSLLIFGTALAFTLPASPGCTRRKPTLEKKPAEQQEKLGFSRLTTPEDVQRSVDEATSHPEVIILVHVDWAPMHRQRERFAEFERVYKTQYPSNDLAFRYIDCTPISSGYEPLRSLPGWKELQDANNGTSLVHGYGELAWIKDSVVLHVERPLNFASPNALTVKTQSLGMGGDAE